MQLDVTIEMWFRMKVRTQANNPRLLYLEVVGRCSTLYTNNTINDFNEGGKIRKTEIQTETHP